MKHLTYQKPGKTPAHRQVTASPLSADERQKIKDASAYLNSLPVTLPPAKEVFGHIPARLDSRAYDDVPIKLPMAKEYFAHLK